MICPKCLKSHPGKERECSTCESLDSDKKLIQYIDDLLRLLSKEIQVIEHSKEYTFTRIGKGLALILSKNRGVKITG